MSGGLRGADLRTASGVACPSWISSRFPYPVPSQRSRSFSPLGAPVGLSCSLKLALSALLALLPSIISGRHHFVHPPNHDHLVVSSTYCTFTTIRFIFWTFYSTINAASYLSIRFCLLVHISDAVNPHIVLPATSVTT